MKTTLAALAALSIAGSAWATTDCCSITPPNTAFTGSGPVSFAISGQPTENCTLTIAGHTNASGPADITSATFTDSGDGSCEHAQPSGLKTQGWEWTAKGFRHADWTHFGTYLSKGIKCGPDGSMWFFIAEDIHGNPTAGLSAFLTSAAGRCSVHGTIYLSQPITVSKNP